MTELYKRNGAVFVPVGITLDCNSSFSFVRFYKILGVKYEM